MNQKPFSRRWWKARATGQLDLPVDLARFYAQNEGVGLESSPDRLVRLCRLDEVVRVGWSDLHVVGQDSFPGWESLSGFRIGMSAYFDELIYVLNSPCCAPGAILAIGVDVSGPGGRGPAPLEPSLVLAASFPEWLERLEQTGWIEYGLAPAGLDELPRAEQQQLRRYYRMLNPAIDWGEA